MKTFLLLSCCCLSALSAVEAPAEDGQPALSDEQKARAAELLAELNSEDALAEEVAPPAKDDGLSKDDRLLLQGLSFDLMEAERWIERGDPSFAGQAFLRFHKQRKAMPKEQRERLAAHLLPLDRRQLALARALMKQLPIKAETEQAGSSGQDAVSEPPADQTKAVQEISPSEAERASQGE